MAGSHGPTVGHLHAIDPRLSVTLGSGRTTASSMPTGKIGSVSRVAERARRGFEAPRRDSCVTPAKADRRNTLSSRLLRQ